MRELKILYGILLSSLEKGDKEGWYNNGICGEIEDLVKRDIILFREGRDLNDHLITCNPSKNYIYDQFCGSKYYKEGSAWWFVRMCKDEGGRRVRIELVKEIIKQL